MDNTHWSYKQENLNALKQAREIGIQICNLYDEIAGLENKIWQMDIEIKSIKIPKLVDDLERLAQVLGERENLKELRQALCQSIDRTSDQLKTLKIRFHELVPLGVWIKCGDDGVGSFGVNQRNPNVCVEHWESLQKDPSLPKFASDDSLA